MHTLGKPHQGTCVLDPLTWVCRRSWWIGSPSAADSAPAAGAGWRAA